VLRKKNWRRVFPTKKTKKNVPGNIPNYKCAGGQPPLHWFGKKTPRIPPAGAFDRAKKSPERGPGGVPANRKKLRPPCKTFRGIEDVSSKAGKGALDQEKKARIT